jgi:hypothetical protein
MAGGIKQSRKRGQNTCNEEHGSPRFGDCHQAYRIRWLEEN